MVETCERLSIKLEKKMSTRRRLKRGAALRLPGCVLLGRQCDLSTREGLKKGASLWFLGCVLLGRIRQAM